MVLLYCYILYENKSGTSGAQSVEANWDGSSAIPNTSPSDSDGLLELDKVAHNLGPDISIQRVVVPKIVGKFELQLYLTHFC